MNEKQHTHVFSMRYRRKFKPFNAILPIILNQRTSAGKVRIQRFERAFMTIQMFETVSIVLCQCSIMDMQVQPVPNQLKTVGPIGVKCIKNAYRGDHI